MEMTKSEKSRFRSILYTSYAGGFIMGIGLFGFINNFRMGIGYEGLFSIAGVTCLCILSAECILESLEESFLTKEIRKD